MEKSPVRRPRSKVKMDRSELSRGGAIVASVPFEGVEPTFSNSVGVALRPLKLAVIPIFEILLIKDEAWVWWQFALRLSFDSILVALEKTHRRNHWRILPIR